MTAIRIEQQLRQELPGAAEDVPVGRVYLLTPTGLMVATFDREDDRRWRIVDARPILADRMLGGQSGLESLQIDAEYAFRAAPGSPTVFLQITGGGETLGLFGQEVCQDGVCLVAVRDTSAWRLEDLHAAGIGNSPGLSCAMVESFMSRSLSCAIRDAQRFTAELQALDQNAFLSRGTPVAYVVPTPSP